MRRSEKEIKDKEEIESIIKRANACRIGLSYNDFPYVVPVTFGYTNNCIYFHSAKQGKKIDIIKQNNKVCFEIDIDHELRTSENPCRWGMKYRSVIGFGKAFFIDDLEGKIAALNIIRQHHLGKSCEFPHDNIKEVIIVEIRIDSMTGKKAGY